ncbi:MAG: MFS transporter, partial [Acidithiobacillales bacterium]
MSTTAAVADRPEPTTFYRWVVLAFLSLGMFANYYVFDAMNPVGPLLESQLGFTQAQIGLLDSAYNVAALLVLLLGGVIIDRAGTIRAVLLFGTIAAAAGLLIALSGSFS